MKFEDIYSNCILKPFVEESYPFDKSTLVFKIGGKMFLLVDSDNPISINVKSDPEKSIELRERYEGIQPGYHMNKKHWITINLIGGVPNEVIINCIDDSYALVLTSLPKKIKSQLGL
ncbi:MAG: MmcQ/YjbR family DNA-binding protein [Bacteroidota bacterium]